MWFKDKVLNNVCFCNILGWALSNDSIQHAMCYGDGRALNNSCVSDVLCEH